MWEQITSPLLTFLQNQTNFNRGLPLMIVVIAGLLSKIGKALDEWKSVAENVSSVVNTDLDVQCMRVLALSYHHLPHHLKPCFLYFAIFPEDKVICVDKLMELWAAEGFLKVEEMENLEQVAEKCLKDLVDRSIISICHSRIDGKMESCGIHDVTREFCLREARNMNFVNVLKRKSDQNPCAESMKCSSKSRGRISNHSVEELTSYRIIEAHSIITFGRLQIYKLELPFKLVRVLDLAAIICPTFPSGILYLIHLRYLALCFYPRLQNLGFEEEVPSSISSLCYLQTFILRHAFPHGFQRALKLPSEIFTMPQLRNLHLDWNYLRNHEPTEKSLVLKNLQCLSGWNPQYCTGSTFRLFPNLKKLQIRGVRQDFRTHKDLYDFCYLHQLEELEFDLTHFLGQPPVYVYTPLLLLPPPQAFPPNLKNLAFNGRFSLPWKDLSIVGKLPKLESLKLSCLAFKGEEWEVAEEGFPRLKFLALSYLDVRYWRASSDHFPCLEKLFLVGCSDLDSIPQDFADITTLALIDIRSCPESVENSAKQIKQDMEDNYASSIEVHMSDFKQAKNLRCSTD